MLCRFVLLCLLGLLAGTIAKGASPHTYAPADTAAISPCPYDTLRINRIEFAGNKKTKPYILEAELDLHPGQLISLNSLNLALERNRVRLVNLQLFHWVKAEVVECHESQIVIRFSMQERWYIWPVPIFSLADRNLNAWLDKMNFQRIDYGIHLKHENFRGRNERLKLNLQFGFNRKYELNYQLPRFSKKPNWGLIGGVLMYQSHYIDYDTRDSRPLNYYNDEFFPTQFLQLNAGVTYRTTSQVQSQAVVTYMHHEIADTVSQLNPRFMLGHNFRELFSIEFIRTLNFRTTYSYPLSGRYMRLMGRQSFPLGGGATYLTTLNARFSYYKPLSKRIFYAVGTEGELKLGSTITYADNRALGYSSNVRGYELYVADGQHFALLKQGLSYGVLTDKLINLKFIKSARFGQIPLSVFLNTFFDVGYVHDNFFAGQNPLTANRPLYSGGLGLHIVTYYDKVFSFEYAFTRDGFHGLFIRGGFPI